MGGNYCFCQRQCLSDGLLSRKKINKGSQSLTKRDISVRIVVGFKIQSEQKQVLLADIVTMQAVFFLVFVNNMLSCYL